MGIEDMDEYSIILHVKVQPNASDEEKFEAIFNEIVKNEELIVKNYDLQNELDKNKKR